jgi:hypothetical protein
MECLLAVQLMEKFTNEPLEGNQLILVKVVKHTDAAQLLIELAIQCSILYLVVR